MRNLVTRVLDRLRIAFRRKSAEPWLSFTAEISGKTIEFELRKVRSGGRVAGYDYFADGELIASSQWDGGKLCRFIAPGWEGLFGETPRK